MKYAIAMLVGAFACSHVAAADVCGQLETFAAAVETNTPNGLTDTPVLGANETECSAIMGLEEVGLGGMRKGVSSVECYWDNTDAETYTFDDVRDMAGHLHACPVLLFDRLEQYDDAIEYKFRYSNQTLFLLGNDESGMYLNIFRAE